MLTEHLLLTELEERMSMYEKRHLTLQSVFIRVECMMHADQNADRHVMDQNVIEQNVDRISREIAYVPLGEKIKSKHSSCMQTFFFFFY